MGTQGVPITVTKSQITEAIKKKKGVGAQICQHFDISYDTFYKLIKKYNLKDELQVARNDFDETICDMAETALMRALNQKEDLSSSLSSAKFVLNNKGRKRGYYPPVAQTQQTDTIVHGIQEGISQLSKESRGQALSIPAMETEQPLSDS